MNEILQMWLFGAAFAAIVSLALSILYLRLEVAKIRTILIITSKRAAEILHSPDDHLGIDSLLDKYKEHEHELTYAQWQELKSRCEEIINNPACTKSERLLALMVVEFSIHKLMLKPSNPKL